jgi:uncharacterized membrane protein
LAAAVVLASACFTRLPSLRGLASAIAVAMLCEALARQLTVPAGSPLFLHERSLAMGLVIAALAGAVWLHGTQGPEVERPASVFLAVLAYLAGLLWLSLEGVDAAARAAAPAWQSEAAGFGLSAVWVLYAGASIAVGMWRDVRALRLGGLALLSLAVMKVYLFDLSFLATGWRVLSFLVLAVVLLLVSTIYQRAMPRRDAPPVPPPAGP